MLADTAGAQRSWSPNTLKIRTTLNYKQIPYKESFLSYPDIASFATYYGISPDTGYAPPRATLPAIVHHDDTGKVIVAMSNSIDIARYLDQICPDHPVLSATSSNGWSNASEAYWYAFRQILNQSWTSGYPIVIPTIPQILDTRGSAWFIRDRQASDKLGRSPLDWGSTDPEEDWNPFRAGLQSLAKSMQHTSDAAPFLLGAQPSYADFALVSFLAWYRRGSETNFDKMVEAAGGQQGALARHYRVCERWVLGQGEVVEWTLKG